MTELTQAELAKKSGFRPASAEGWTKGMMRCGRYDYREVEVHTTNPDHLVRDELSSTNVPSLRITARYAAGRKGG
ncbi:hypothetical protein A5676_04455 [Mycobacterium malmoense]|uniref:hypothetical protein n=1 Tax=Mycobacterium malmoense TaxID=1780 RepID=UPI00080BDC79|nr:hypothetical protein [Mycobacterium malmoense]OCB32816.1 hypothetical protein A5676_04455 [Mycobacterium malmoense]